MKRIVVIGGGISGLAAAYRLKQQAAKLETPLEIQLLEASPHLGGSMVSSRRDGFLLEGGPDCFLSDKPRALAFCRELGLTDQIINTRPELRRSFIVRGGKLHSVPEGFYLLAPARLRPFLTSPLLSWPGKWRALMEPLLPGRAMTDESLGSFVRRRMGKELLNWLAQPLVAGIYAADPETLSLKAVFPQFIQLEEKYGSVLLGLKMSQRAKKQKSNVGQKTLTAVKSASGARYSLFISLRDGMQSLVDALENHLSGVQIRRGTPVKTVRRAPDSAEGWRLRLDNGEVLSCDAVCLTLPAYRCGELLQEEHPSLARELNAIPYAGVATLNFAFPEAAIHHPLDGFGFVTPHLESRPTLACTFAHRKFAGRAPAGQALLRAFVGGAFQADLLAKDDPDLQRTILADLRELLGISGEPLFSDIRRWPGAIPQYTLGHVQRILAIEELILGLPGLALAGNWLRGSGIPDCIESGERAADNLMDRIATPVDQVALPS
jgi:protoporphyrinogen/coproporphyrinogen III oxidase